MSRRLWQRWINALLHLYPRNFRARFGADLASQYPAPERSPVRAGASAARELVTGGVGARLDDARAHWRADMSLDSLRADAGRATRRLTRHPAFAVTVVLVLALAAGLNAAVFSILDVTLLRPLPYPNENQIVSIGSEWTGFRHSASSGPEYFDYLERGHAFRALAVFRPGSLNLSPIGDRPAERVGIVRASPSFFDVLGVAPLSGRTFSAQEDASPSRVVILSHKFWMRRFAGDPAVVGTDMATDSGPARIIGVMPARFAYPSEDIEAWMPLGLQPGGPPNARRSHNLNVIGRLRDGVTLEAAQREMQGLAADMQKEYPSAYPAGSGWSVSVISLRDRLVGDVRVGLQVLMAGVALVLVIACANVANLLVARAASSGRELATLTALGAARGRLIRESLFEGLLLGAVGGAIGLLFAALLVAGLGGALPEGLTHANGILTDIRVVSFSIGLTIAAGVATALFTAIRTTRVDAAETLRAGRSTADAPAYRARAALTAVQVALAVTLLMAGGVAMSSFARLLAINSGLDTSRVATAGVALSSTRFPDHTQRVAFFDRILESLSRQPGVVSAGAISVLPLSGVTSDAGFDIEGFTPASEALAPDEQLRVTHGDYFGVMGIATLTGRTFTGSDTIASPPVAVVNQMLATKYWNGGSAVGRRLRLSSAAGVPWITVVGVVADTRDRSLADPPVPMLYLAAAQQPPWYRMSVVARFAGAADDANAIVVNAVRSVDSAQPVFDARTMTQWLDRSVSQPRFSLMLIALFAACAIVLASGGLYGVMSFAVSRRTQELGVRLALGASPAALMRAVLLEATTLTAVGIVAGAIAAQLATRSMGAVFTDLRPSEPAIVIAVPLLVWLVALLAAFVPARRAMRVSPTEALRHQ